MKVWWLTNPEFRIPSFPSPWEGLGEGLLRNPPFYILWEASTRESSLKTPLELKKS